MEETMNNSATASPLSLKVISSSATSVNLSWYLTPPALQYGINCTTTNSTSPEDVLANESFLSRSQCIYYTVDNSTSSLLVTGLSQATSYTCCLQDHPCSPLACADVTTMEGNVGTSGGGGGLTGATAGVVGGVIGVLLVLVLLLAVAGIILAVFYYRKRQNGPPTRKPIARKQSQRYSTRSSKGSSLGRNTSIKSPSATGTDTLHTMAAHHDQERDTDDNDHSTRSSISEEETTQEPTMSQEEKEEALYASASIPANTLRHILHEDTLASLTESCEEPDQYEPMLALKPPGPIYGNVTKPKQPLVPDYVNYPKRS